MTDRIVNILWWLFKFGSWPEGEDKKQEVILELKCWFVLLTVLGLCGLVALLPEDVQIMVILAAMLSAGSVVYMFFHPATRGTTGEFLFALLIGPVFVGAICLLQYLKVVPR